MKKAVILDANAMIYRSHFALKNMKNSKGLSTGATYGFITTLENIIKEIEPDFLVACFDVRRSELKRSQELESYKAHRDVMPEELVYQQEYIMEILDGYKIPKYKVNGYEADDVISTFAKNFSQDSEEEIEVFVLTGDKDLSQLVNEKINVVLFNRDKEKKSNFNYIKTDEDVVNYLGVTPDKIPDLFGLMGDSSDGIPGVSGVGPKNGVKLIKEYGNLEKLYENIEKIKGKMRENLENGKENAFLSRKLATVHKDVEVEYDKEKLKFQEKDLEKLLILYKKLEFKKMSTNIEKELKKLGKLSKLSSGKLFENLNLSENSVINVGDKLNNIEMKTNSGNQLSLFANVEKEVKKNNEKNLEILNEMENEVAIFENEFGIAVSDNNKNVTFLTENFLNKSEIYKILSKKKIIAYNIKEMIKKGLNVTEYFDVMLAWYVLGTESSHELENIIFSEFEENFEKFEDQFKKRKMEDISTEEKVEFIWKRAFALKKLSETLSERLKNEDLEDVFYNLESKLVPVLANMELNGIKIDREHFENYKQELKEDIENLEKSIYSLSGEKFNIGSPKQLAEILFEKMEIEPVKKGKTGYSTDVAVLEILALREIEIAKKLLEYRAKTKLLSTYVEPLPKLADENDKIHTTFNQNGTATGRLSSTNPNIQNIPVKTDEGIKIRKGFVAEDGWLLVSFDYSQIELRVLAELSKDENLVNAYKDDKDLHDLTARKLFVLDENNVVSREQRSIAKVINFSILYGKTPFGLSQELKIPVEDASKYIKMYFEQYPRVKEFLEEILEDARLNGFVETLFGTRRYIVGINSGNKNEQNQANRMAVNTVVQGTAANIIKKVMIELYNEFKDKNDIKMLLQVHDELIFEIKEEVLDVYINKIKEIMENTVKFKNVKLSANGNYAKNWGELK